WNNIPSIIDHFLFLAGKTSSLCMMTVSIIEDRGNAYFSFSISTSIMEIIDKVKGNCIEKVVPSPYFDSIDILPPNDSIVFFTTSKPTPRPEISETSSAVENPLDNINS